MKREVDFWLSYFRKNNLYIDIDTALYLYRLLRKRKRDLREERNLEELEKNKYRMNVLEDIIMSLEGYLQGDYLDILTFMKDNTGKVYKVIPSYKLSPTYRIVSYNPSFGNLDDFLRKMVVSREDHYLVSLDYKHQEPWIIVNLLDNEELKYLLNNNRKDFYEGLMKKFNVDISEENRKIMKKVWNTSIYGSSLDSIQEDGMPWIDEVYNWINNMDEINSLRRKVEHNMKNHKEIYTIFGLNRKLSFNGKVSVRQAFNSIFQMSGSGVLYTGLKSINNAVTIRKLNNDIRVYLTNHDEYILEVNNRITPDELKDFINSISFEIDGWTKPEFDIKIGRSWGEIS